MLHCPIQILQFIILHILAINSKQQRLGRSMMVAKYRNGKRLLLATLHTICGILKAIIYFPSILVWDSIVSCTSLHINNDIVMLDCGEGSAGQLARQAYYTSILIEQYYQRLKVIFISRIHADHLVSMMFLLCGKNTVKPKKEMRTQPYW